MRKNRLFLIIIFIFSITIEVSAQAPQGYYSNAVGKSGRELQDSLRSIIDGHKRIHYNCSSWDTITNTPIEYDTCLFKMFPLTDPSEEPGYDIYDMYYGCNFHADDHGGSSTDHCVIFEREHTFPKSLFRGTASDAYTDLFNLYPADRVVNNTKNANPFGEINPANCSHCFQDGSGIGANCYVPPFDDIENFSGTVFEPLDAFKGDFARSLLYMSIRYMREDDFWISDPDSSAMADRSQFRPWILNMLIEWHNADPVSYKEIRRNNAVFAIQGNRNPLIDHPELVSMIWGNDSTHYTFSEVAAPAPHLTAFSQPSADIVQLEFSEPVTLNPENVNIWPGHPEITSVQAVSSTTVQLVLATPLTEGKRYKCSLYNIQNPNTQAFMRDTILTLKYGYTTEAQPIAGWTFPQSTATGRIVPADADCAPIAGAAIYCNGTHGASDFALGGSDQVSLSNGVATGNLCSSEASKALPFKKASTAANNGDAFVIKCDASDFQNIKLSFSSKCTSTGFKKLTFEWSNGGDFYAHDSLDLTSEAGSWGFHQIDFSGVSELNEQDSIMLRVTLNDATGSGNVTFDNIFVSGTKCISDDPTIYYDTVFRGQGYTGHGFDILEVQTQQTGTRIFQREVPHPDDCTDLYLLYLTVLEPSHVGINEQPQMRGEFVIYPNPATESVTVKGAPMREVSVFNGMGQRVAHLTVNAEQTTINVSNLPAGLYIFAITTAEGKKVMKKVVVR